jgi:hypothetical protein
MKNGYWHWKHTLVAEEVLGRPLRAEERVVHIAASDNDTVENIGIQIVIPLEEYARRGQ